MRKDHSSYLTDVLNPANLPKTVGVLLEQIGKTFCLSNVDSFVVRGVSGITMGSILSYLTGKTLVISRKGSEDSHARGRIENVSDAGNFVIVDDLISTGATIAEALLTIRESLTADWRSSSDIKQAKCLGVAFYCSDEAQYPSGCRAYAQKALTAKVLWGLLSERGSQGWLVGKWVLNRQKEPKLVIV